jgi:hypothetical protein
MPRVVLLTMQLTQESLDLRLLSLKVVLVETLSVLVWKA